MKHFTCLGFATFLKTFLFDISYKYQQIFYFYLTSTSTNVMYKGRKNDKSKPIYRTKTSFSFQNITALINSSLLSSIDVC